MRIAVRNRCPDHDGYRAARVRSLFNVESGCEFALDAELPVDDGDWSLGLVVGPSGSGKTSLGRALFGEEAFRRPAWPDGLPIIEAIAPEAGFDAVAAALSAVGLGSVPAWLRPYRVLSTGERFRADLARLVVEAPARAVVDEFTGVVDRQVARFGALAFAKAWRRTAGRCVLLSCHYDVADWLEPDWVFDTATGRFSGRGLHRRPRFELEVRRGSWDDWPLFEPHHYLKLPRMIAATNYLGLVEGTPVCHVAVSTRAGMREARACRLVVMPEWQGAGVGLRFLNEVCRLWLAGENRYGLPLQTLFHTSHPGLAAALRRDPRWSQVSCPLHGEAKARSIAGHAASAARGRNCVAAGYGGHFRAVQGFRYYGEEKK
jgi:GNAT superfamily N-acetyltransferase